MMDEQKQRFAELQQPWCTGKLLIELYGLDLDTDNPLLGAFRAWAARFRRGQEIERQRNGREYHRHELETFLQANGLVSLKWGAVELGMEAESLAETLDCLKGKSLLVNVAKPISEQIIEESVVRNLHKSFPDLRGRIFPDHDAKCRKLHEAIRKDCGVDVKSIHCVTSQILEPTEPDYAAAFDAITLEPVGLRYQVWLDFKKPVNLRPDCCSLKLFARERELIEPFLMRGEAPDVPEALLNASA